MDNQATADPERPIRTKSEDLLDRAGFVTRLSDALINRKTGLATGVTLGLTGEWGSGKSSVLNLLDEIVSERYPNALIIRFDPWLISGRDDLISQFFLDLRVLFKSNPAIKSKFAVVLEKLERYRSHLAPIGNLASPGAGSAFFGVIAFVKAVCSGDATLHKRREELLIALKNAGAPVVVLIDELDRIEDAEIRTVAQLVRAVADFPSISYVLAYDHNRVVQALGAGGDGAEPKERGRAYLEKIVQFQISLPVTFGEELNDLLLAELDKLTTDLALPREWQTNERFIALLGTMVPRPIETPRDVKRLVGTYHVIGSMLRGEVDWVDLLAFSALLIKAPATVAKLRQDPDQVVENPLSPRIFYERMSEAKDDGESELNRFIPEEEAASEVNGLLGFLFSRFSPNSIRDDRHSDSLCFRRPLITVLRMGLPEGVLSRGSIETLLSSNPEEIEQALWDLYQHQKLGALLDRFESIYSQMDEIDHHPVWLGVSRFVRRRDALWPHAYSPMRDTIDRLSQSAMDLCKISPGLRHKMTEIVQLLIDDGDIYLSSSLLFDQIRHYGLFKIGKTERGHEILPIEEARNISTILANQLRDRHLNSRLAIEILNPKPIFLVTDTGKWDQSCKGKMEDIIQDDAGIDAFALMLFGGNYATGRNFISELLDLDIYLKRVKERTASESLQSAHPTLRKALEKALSRDFP